VFGGAVQQELMQGDYLLLVYTSVTRSRYSNVVNTANQILGAREYRACTRECALQGVSFMPGQEWMFGLTEGAFCWNAHSNYSSISGPFCFKQHRRVLH
jgi:hypothetical protein